MRVADKMAYNQVNANIGKNRSEMHRLQDQAATQKRVTKPSDDPVAASRVLFARTEQRGNEQFVKNLNYAKSFLEISDQTLSEVSEILMRAKELAISQANDAGSNEQTKRAVAAEIRQLKDQMIQIGNRKLGERYIFGGFQTQESPFTQDGEYTGDSGEMKIHVDKDSFLSMNIPGNAIFLGEGITRDGVTKLSPKQPENLEELTEAKQSYLDELQAKAQENNPPELPADQAEQSEVLQRGPASLRTPPTATEIGPINMDQDKGVNVFKAMKDMEISLRANDKYGVQESIDSLDDALQQVILARAAIGSRASTIDTSLDSMHSLGVNTKATISQLEDADVFQVISDMNRTESSLEATLSTSGKLIQKSLLDFIS